MAEKIEPIRTSLGNLIKYSFEKPWSNFSANDYDTLLEIAEQYKVLEPKDLLHDTVVSAQLSSPLSVPPLKELTDRMYQIYKEFYRDEAAFGGAMFTGKPTAVNPKVKGIYFEGIELTLFNAEKLFYIDSHPEPTNEKCPGESVSHYGFSPTNSREYRSRVPTNVPEKWTGEQRRAYESRTSEQKGMPRAKRKRTSESERERLLERIQNL